MEFMDACSLKKTVGPKKYPLSPWNPLSSKGSLVPRRIIGYQKDPCSPEGSYVTKGLRILIPSKDPLFPMDQWSSIFKRILGTQKDPRYSEGSLVFRRILGPQKDPLTPRDQGSPERSCVPKGSRIHRWILCPQGIKGSPVSKGWKILGMILNLKLPKKLLS